METHEQKHIINGKRVIQCILVVKVCCWRLPILKDDVWFTQPCNHNIICCTCNSFWNLPPEGQKPLNRTGQYHTRQKSGSNTPCTPHHHLICQHTHAWKVRETLPLDNVRPNTMDADYDGPCAVPQPDAIQESMADPLAVFGFALIASSLLMLAYTGTGERHRRYGCQEILDFSSAVCLNTY